MNNLADTYGALGRHKDALRMKQETLALFRRILPEDHPHIATLQSLMFRRGDEIGAHTNLKCKNEHGLVRFVTPHDSFSCDVCHGSVPEGAVMFGCDTCDYDVCSTCEGGEQNDQ